jgi:hypothetical protein
MDYNSMHSDAIQNFSKLIKEQDDPTTRPYVKDKSFFDSITNTPIENSKMAAYRDTISNLELLKIANSRLPGAREGLMATAQGLMKQSADATAHDADIRNEMAKRQTISNTLQGMQDVTNPMEAANIGKILEAVTGMKYNPAENMAMYGSKESHDMRYMQGLKALMSILGQARGQDMDYELALMQGFGGSGGGRNSNDGLVNFNVKDAIAANKAFYGLLDAARNAKTPHERKRYMDEAGNTLSLYILQDPRRNPDTNRFQMTDDYNKAMNEFYQIDEKARREEQKNKATFEDVANGKMSYDDETDRLIRSIHNGTHHFINITN